MGVPNLREKFKIVERAAALAGKRLVQRNIARAVFPEANVHESAWSMWSACKNGQRNFSESRLVDLVRAINDETDGLLNDIQAGDFLKPTRQVERAFIDAGLVDSVAAEPRPISEVLRNIENTDHVLGLLRTYPHTYETSNELQIGFHLLAADKDLARKMALLLYQFVEASWDVRGRLGSARVGGAMLARIWSWLADAPEVDRLNSWLESRISDLPCRFVPVADACCYIGTLYGRHGPFRANIERVIEDPDWRGTDYREQLRYHGGYKNLARHIAGHFVNRRGHPQVLCNDIGRVISIYPQLARHREFADLAAFLKEETMKSLAYADIKRSMRGRVEDIMEPRAN